MPYVKKRAATKVALPSDPNYFVMWRTNVTYGEVKAIAKGLPKADAGDAEGENARGNAIADRMLLLYIEAWNLDDEDGNILPLNAESLNEMQTDDVAFLSKRLSEDAEKKEEDRKN